MFLIFGGRVPDGRNELQFRSWDFFKGSRSTRGEAVKEARDWYRRFDKMQHWYQVIDLQTAEVIDSDNIFDCKENSSI